MKALAEGATTKSIGMGITLPFESDMNEFVDIPIMFEHFFIRKYWLLHSAKAVIAFSGGIGTTAPGLTSSFGCQVAKP